MVFLLFWGVGHRGFILCCHLTTFLSVLFCCTSTHCSGQSDPLNLRQGERRSVAIARMETVHRLPGFTRSSVTQWGVTVTEVVHCSWQRTEHSDRWLQWRVTSAECFESKWWWWCFANVVVTSWLNLLTDIVLHPGPGLTQPSILKWSSTSLSGWGEGGVHSLLSGSK